MNIHIPVGGFKDIDPESKVSLSVAQRICNQQFSTVASTCMLLTIPSAQSSSGPHSHSHVKLAVIQNNQLCGLYHYNIHEISKNDYSISERYSLQDCDRKYEKFNTFDLPVFTADRNKLYEAVKSGLEDSHPENND